MKKPSEGMAKAQGMAKQVMSKLSGDDGILNTLAKEHGEVSGMMMRIEATREDDGAATRQELFEKMAVELLSHAHAEDRTFYDALERYPESQNQLKDSRNEHQEIERHINELDAIPYSSSEWKQRFLELKNVVQHHVDEEESDVFEIAKDVMSKDELQALDERFHEEKQREKDRLLGRGAPLGRGAGEASPPPAAP